MEGAIKAMKDGKTGFCPNAGISELREILADNVSASRGVWYKEIIVHNKIVKKDKHSYDIHLSAT